MENKSLDTEKFTKRRQMLKKIFRYAVEIVIDIILILIGIEIFA